LSPRYRPVAPEALPDLVAERAGAVPGTVRVAVDGPLVADPHALAAALAEPLRLRGRPVALVRAETFWRDASLRLEYGHRDADAYLDWVDAAALRREVLDPVPSGSYLPSLRDPVTNRSTRAPARPAPAGTVLVVSGQFLLGLGLPFELAVHLQLSPAALARRGAEEWTLPAFARYAREVRPEQAADLTIRLDDPRHPAVLLADPARGARP
jgi:hypothetical protein